ncbi:hypothetical protein MML48_2g00020762 [Holotrichia oblita]|uniref:Uncharacterized protein n=1 Tax=Holotrichia oblita TaxID=644536 RepID=A0ACB9TMV1_HOLOL|nr:hypothetical protein MML48_2g00020762 [Holotrichia oblita]
MKWYILPLAGSKKHLDILDGRQLSRGSKSSLDDSEKYEEIDKLSLEDLTAVGTLRARAAVKRRDSAGRRSSDGESLHDSKRSLTRRQISQTQSEPDNSEHTVFLPVRAGTVERSVTFAEPKIKVIPPSNPAPQASPRGLLLAMHSEYTSITDELESVCGLLSPPRTPRLLSPPRPGQSTSAQGSRRRCASEMSNPEIALFIEKEHLRDAEENDYMLMENLIQRRYDEEQEEGHAAPTPMYLTVLHETKEYRSPRLLRRSTAIEDDNNDLLIPSCSGSAPDNSTSAQRQDSSESQTTSELIPLVDQQILQRPSIIIDSSQLPIQTEVLQKADSKASLHMQSETMC